ncbi:hypothetical protein HKX48_005519 [Thoreauomyces humboldtii]|nr:hypothetical protein HKX48_005519 [Thoreauomyces humboldtii]
MTPRGIQIWFQNRRAKEKALVLRGIKTTAAPSSSAASSAASVPAPIASKDLPASATVPSMAKEVFQPPRTWQPVQKQQQHISSQYRFGGTEQQDPSNSSGSYSFGETEHRTNPQRATGGYQFGDATTASSGSGEAYLPPDAVTVTAPWSATVSDEPIPYRDNTAMVRFRDDFFHKQPAQPSYSRGRSMSLPHIAYDRHAQKQHMTSPFMYSPDGRTDRPAYETRPPPPIDTCRVLLSPMQPTVGFSEDTFVEFDLPSSQTQTSERPVGGYQHDIALEPTHQQPHPYPGNLYPQVARTAEAAEPSTNTVPHPSWDFPNANLLGRRGSVDVLSSQPHHPFDFSGVRRGSMPAHLSMGIPQHQQHVQQQQPFEFSALRRGSCPPDFLASFENMGFPDGGGPLPQQLQAIDETTAWEDYQMRQEHGDF